MPYETGSVKDREVNVTHLAYLAGRLTVDERVDLERDRLATVETEPGIWVPSQPVDTDALLRVSPNYDGNQLPGQSQ